MAQIIDMPKLSDTMTVGTLVKWLKKEGDAVKSGDILAEVETDKATMELESFFDGVLLKRFANEGEQVAIGAALCAIGEKGEKVETPAPKPPPAKSPKAGRPRPKTRGQKSEDSLPRRLVPPKPGEGGSAGAEAGGQRTVVRGPVVRGPVIRISPLARRLAAEKGIDCTGLQGTGPGGRIVRDDILAAEKVGRVILNAPSAAAAASPGPPPVSPAAEPDSAGPAPAPPPPREGKLTPVSNMRATIARRLVEAKSQIPHFYLEIEIDAAPLLELRQKLYAQYEKDGVKLSINDFVLKACAEALLKVPAVNSSWENAPPSTDVPGSGQGGIRQYDAVHMAFAVAIDDGLITPVIRDAHQKTVRQISTEVRELAALARSKKLKPGQFTGGTFCVSNLGMMGIDRFSAIINPPMAAILAVGAIVKKPVVQGARVVPGQRLSLTLSCDHRAVDGATGATWLAALKPLLENPAQLPV